MGNGFVSKRRNRDKKTKRLKNTPVWRKRVFLLSDCIYTRFYMCFSLSLSLAVLLCIYYKTIFNKTSRSDQYCVARRNLTRTVSSSSSCLCGGLSTSSLVSSETNELIKGVCGVKDDVISVGAFTCDCSSLETMPKSSSSSSSSSFALTIGHVV